jgi:8-oxo-dGTP diphosphatase
MKRLPGEVPAGDGKRIARDLARVYGIGRAGHAPRVVPMRTAAPGCEHRGADGKRPDEDPHGRNLYEVRSPGMDERAQSWPAIGVAARGVVMDDEGRVLLIKRASDVWLDPDRWELPGGKMDHGELLDDALAREVREETGLEVRVGEPVHVCQFTVDPFWVTCITFACERTGGEVVLSEEHGDFAWVAPAELAQVDLASNTKDQLEAYAAKARAR